MEYVIKVSNITKKYMLYDDTFDILKEALGFNKRNNKNEFLALDNITFNLKKGETLGIIGENGAGKSTLLKILTGVLEPNSGEVLINGKMSALLELGTGFNPEYTGIENIYLNGIVNGFTKEDVDKKIDKILMFADIGDFVYQKVKTYSSGMFARLAFSVAIHVDPSILIVDEALSVGDIFFQQKCYEYMKKNMKNVSKILVSHDMSSIANMADRVILLSKGRCVFYGEPLKAIELYTKKLHNDIFSSNKNFSLLESDNKEKSKFDEINWECISNDSIGGALGAVIDKFKIFVNNTQYKGYVKKDDIIKISEKIDVKIDIEKAIFGYQIKDKYGNVIFGENTSNKFEMMSMNRNKTYIVNISFKWPQIKNGEYFLTLGIGSGNDEMNHVIQCWAHNITNFTSIGNKAEHGLFNNEIENFFIKEV